MKTVIQANLQKYFLNFQMTRSENVKNKIVAIKTRGT